MRRLALALALLVCTAIVPPTASAIVPGPNGPILFTSGRDDGLQPFMNETAQIWMRFDGGGVQRITTANSLHHRHSSWSPDRTKIAYARGPSGFAGPWDIFVFDLTQPAGVTNPANVTSSAGSEDRPTWSPDGTTLAYSKADAGGNWDVVTQLADGAGGETMIGDDASAGAGASGQFPRPQWSPDGATIYYGRGVDTNDYDIYRSPADGSNPLGTAVVTGTGNDYQPSLSPDGSTLCYTRDSGADKNVVVDPVGAGTVITDLAPGGIDYECAWSPDGQRIAFTRGAFGAGELRVRDANATGSTDTLANSTNDFDGNAEWAFNPTPTCTDHSATVERNGFVTIPLECADEPDPPSFGDNTPQDPEVLVPPSNGVLGSISDEETVVYTPDVNFEGTDTFTYGTSDGNTDSEPATVTITVGEGGNGGPAPGDPEITEFAMSRTRFRRGSDLPSAAQAAVGTTISFDLSEAATVRFSFQRARKGRRVNGRCRKPTRRNRSKRRCTRYVRAGSFSLDLSGGDRDVRFEGRLSRTKRLKVGRHRLTLSARDDDGNGSNKPRKKFRIVRG